MIFDELEDDRMLPVRGNRVSGSSTEPTDEVRSVRSELRVSRGTSSPMHREMTAPYEQAIPSIEVNPLSQEALVASSSNEEGSAELIPARVSTSMFDPEHQYLGDLLKNCHLLDKATEAIRLDLLKNIYLRINVLASKKQWLDAAEVATVMYGVRNFKDGEEIRDFLIVITRHIEGTDSLFESQDIGGIFIGLRNMPMCDATHDLLRAMFPHLWGNFRNEEYLSPRSIADGFYGLQSMNDSPVVLSTLRALVEHVRPSREKDNLFSIDDITTIFNVLGKQPDSAVVRHILLRLEPHIRTNWESKEYLAPNAIEDVLDGIKNIPDCLEVKILLAAVIPHIHMSTQTEQWLPAKNISGIIYGLQKQSNHGEVRGILRALLPHIQKIVIGNPDQFDTKMLGILLFGLQKMVASFDIDAVLMAILPHIQNSVLNWPKADYQDTLHVEIGLQKMHDSPHALAILQFLERNIQTSVIETARMDNADPAMLSRRLFEYQNIVASSQVVATLDIMLPRIQTSSTEWTAKQLSQAVCGLREMEDSTEAVAILKALTARIPDIKFNDAQLKNYAPWLAGEIYSVMYYLMNPLTLNVAKAYLQAIGLRLKNTRENWSDEDVNDPKEILKAHEKLEQIFAQFQEAFLDKMEIASLPTEIFLATQMASLCGYDLQQDEMELDLHFCTYPMARILCTYAVANFIDNIEEEKGDLRTLDIIFGTSSHNLENEGEMEKVVNDALANLNDKIWNKKNHEWLGRKMIRFEPMPNLVSPEELSRDEPSSDASASEGSSPHSEEADVDYVAAERFKKQPKMH